MMNIVCTCGSENFFIQPKGSQTGLYCKSCGAWQKWLNKKEVRAFSYMDTKTLDVVNLTNIIINDKRDTFTKADIISLINQIG